MPAMKNRDQPSRAGAGGVARARLHALVSSIDAARHAAAVAVRAPALVRAQMPVLRFQFARRRAAPLPFAAYVDALVADLDHDLPLAWGRTRADGVLRRRHAIAVPARGDRSPSCSRPARACASRRAAEITLETNPGTAEHGRFEGYRAAGVNRLSFGVQSFDDGCLQRLGRIHDSARGRARGEARAGRRLRQLQPRPDVRAAGADPGDGRARRRARDRAAARAPVATTSSRWSRTPCSPRARPRAFPTTTTAWDMQEALPGACSPTPGSRSTKSAPTRGPGAQCAHNLNYWRFGDYLGIGAGAHGKLTLGARTAGAAPLEGQASRRLPGHAPARRPRSAATRPSTARASAVRLHAQCAAAQ